MYINLKLFRKFDFQLNSFLHLKTEPTSRENLIVQ